MNTPNNGDGETSPSLERNSQHRPLDGRTVSNNELNARFVIELQQAFGALMQHLQELHAWRDQVTASLDTVCRTTMSISDGLRAVALATERVEEAIQKDASARAAQRADVANLEAQIARLANANGAQIHNLEQVRLQGEGLARNFEKLSQELIAREIKDPFFVAFARLYEAVYALSGRAQLGDEDLQPILSRIRGFLEDYNIEIIHPDDGEPFDPRRHQPVKTVPTPDPALHGRLACTFNVGLASGQRLIQPARVAVLRPADPSPTDPIKP